MAEESRLLTCSQEINWFILPEKLFFYVLKINRFIPLGKRKQKQKTWSLLH